MSGNLGNGLFFFFSSHTFISLSDWAHKVGVTFSGIRYKKKSLTLDFKKHFNVQNSATFSPFFLWFSLQLFIKRCISDNHSATRHPKTQFVVVAILLLSPLWLFVTPWTVARQTSLSVGFPRQEYWSGLPFPSPGNGLSVVYRVSVSCPDKKHWGPWTWLCPSLKPSHLIAPQNPGSKWGW